MALLLKLRYFLFISATAFVLYSLGLVRAQEGNADDKVPEKRSRLVKPEDRPMDGYFEKKNIANSEPSKYPHLREADVVYSIRIWRDIDTRLKINHIFSSPKGRLIDYMLYAIDNELITPYSADPTDDDPDGDRFTKILFKDEVRNKLGGDSVQSPEFNDKGEKIGETTVYNEFNPDSIVKFRLKEDWIFDRNRSVFEPRIVGIAPLVKIKSVSGITISDQEQPAFWIYFPEFRHVLATKLAWVRNDATTLSFDDVFVKRIFDSYIVKQSNPENNMISYYKKGIEQLYESERIKKSLMEYEHDLWEY